MSTTEQMIDATMARKGQTKMQLAAEVTVLREALRLEREKNGRLDRMVDDLRQTANNVSLELADTVATLRPADATVTFVARENGPERLLCEAEISFGSGVLAGMKLVGFALYQSPDGEVYVTFPSRAFGAGSDRRYFDFLRSTTGLLSDARRVKSWILDRFRMSNPGFREVPANLGRGTVTVKE